MIKKILIKNFDEEQIDGKNSDEENSDKKKSKYSYNKVKIFFYNFFFIFIKMLTGYYQKKQRKAFKKGS